MVEKANLCYYTDACFGVSSSYTKVLGSFNSPVGAPFREFSTCIPIYRGGISESRHLTLEAPSRLKLFKQNG